jgi:hypothetical protein
MTSGNGQRCNARHYEKSQKYGDSIIACGGFTISTSFPSNYGYNFQSQNVSTMSQIQKTQQ